MMKQRLFWVMVLVTLLLSSCGNSQKPADRIGVWDKEADIIVVEAENKMVKVRQGGNKTLVPFKRLESGLAEVQVSINGVPFNMWWDTGASVTCISLLELQKLVKENKISIDDHVGSAMTKIADGSSTENAVFIIKEIYIQGRDGGGLIVNDIAAMVSPNTEAPLLLGQNVIANLPKHSFNETTGLIEFDKE